ncbi:hypothetical protein PROFUN_15396 [Planoprotostelium fungivorum]|uniref:Retrotransposon gag domain-containing protein n=1 Tax=Planoprotostelium fungivorum TaxID=1890364 RepID=A0A2P6MVE5_9EUKA|nr:hypothetical protein PROFUN_15396 [Planoprotostelium fungivorum]
MPPKAFETPADLAQAAKEYGGDTWREQMSYITQTGSDGHPQEQLNGLKCFAEDYQTEHRRQAFSVSLGGNLCTQIIQKTQGVVTESFRDISVFEKHNFLKETFTGYFHRDLEETSRYEKASILLRQTRYLPSIPTPALYHQRHWSLPPQSRSHPLIFFPTTYTPPMSQPVNELCHDQFLEELRNELLAVDNQLLKIRPSRKDEIAVTQRLALQQQRTDLLHDIEATLELRKSTLDTLATINKLSLEPTIPPVDQQLIVNDAPAPITVPTTALTPITAPTVTSTTHSTKVPHDLPCFMDSTGKGRSTFTDPVKFTRKFEAILEANGLNVEHHWERLFRCCVEDDRYLWAKDNIFGRQLTWDAFTTLLHSHFDQADLNDRLREELITTTMHARETVQQFADRFRGLMLQAGVADDESIANTFIHQLPPLVSASILGYRKMHRATHTTDRTFLSRVHNIVDFAIQQDDVLRRSTVTTTVPTTVPRRDRDNNPPSSPIPRTNDTNHCGISGHKGHSSSECFTLHPELIKNHVCKICKDRGHFPSSCPAQDVKTQLRTSATDTTKNHKIRRIYHEPEPIEEPPNYNDVDTYISSVVPNLYLRSLRGPSTTPTDRFTLPLLINGIRTPALLDTGADRSYMHRSFAEKHHIPIIPATGLVSLAIATTSSTCTGHTFPINVTYGQPGHSITRSITFHIVDLNDFDVYIGGNNLEHIGIVIPIATSYPDEITVSDPALTPDPAPAPASTHNTCHNHLPNTNSLLREGGDVVTEVRH